MLSALVCVVGFTLGAGLPGEAAYLAGYEALADKRYADAEKAFAEAAAAGGPLLDFAIVRGWEAKCLKGDAEAEKPAWAYAHTSGGAAAALCKSRLGLHLANTERAEQAASLLMPLLEMTPAPWWMDAQTWDAADALVRAGGAQLPTGYEFFRKLVERPGYVPQRNDAAKRLKDSPDPVHRRVAAYTLFRSGFFDEVEKILASSPLDLHDAAGAPMTLEAFDLALKSAPPDPAAQPVLAPLLTVNQSNPWFPLLLSRAVRANFKAQNLDGARGLTMWFFGAAPQDRDAGDNLWFIAQTQMSRAPEAALALYQMLMDKAPQHGRVTNAANEIVQYWLRKNDLPKAQAAAESLGSAFPESRFRTENYYALALRWRAAGNENAALRDFAFAANGAPGEYFAHRALQQLQEALPSDARPVPLPVNWRVDGAQPVLQPMPGLALPLTPLPADDVYLQRIRFFARYGMEEAEWSAIDAMRTLNGGPEDCARYLAIAEAGAASTAQAWADKQRWGVEGNSKTVERLRLDFPRPYFDVYEAQAKAVGVDPYFLLSISKQESIFRAPLVSRSGAMGVMQLMPGTAAWMTKGTPGLTTEMASRLFEPVNCIAFGGNYIAQMLNKFNGNMLYATAAYNGGPGNVSKWLKTSPGAAPDVFTEIIPYEETKGYVRKVLGNYAAYRSLYP